MSGSIREKLISYLAAGVSQSAAAEAAGVSASYVSQLLEEQGVRQEVAAKRGEKLNKHLGMDELVESGEKKALEKVISMIPYSRSLAEVTKAFTALNGAKKKTAVLQGADDGAAGMMVTIVLPKAAELMLQVNSQNQVVEVQGRSIAPLPSRELPRMAAALAHRTGPASVPALDAPVKPHVVEHHQRRDHQDRELAQKRLSILEDHTLVLNGVQVVI